MGVKKIEIVLDEATGRFYSDSSGPSRVTGRVLIQVDTAVAVNDIVLKSKGKAAVRWTLQTGSGKSKRSTTYWSRRGYYNEQILLFGAAKEKMMLTPGEHCFPFNTVLHAGLPSSFEGRFGRVRYTLEVVIDRPWRFSDKQRELITVVSPLDLNLYPESLPPVTRTSTHTFSDVWHKTAEPMCLEVSLPTTGFLPGDVIPVTVHVDNKSHVVISEVVVRLQMVTTFHAENHTRNNKKRDRSFITSHSIGSVGKTDTRSWNQPVTLPPNSEYHNLTKCSIIDVDYELAVVAIASGLHHNVEVIVPLLIGSRTRTASVPSDDSKPSTSADPPPKYQEVTCDLPPSYSQLF